MERAQAWLRANGDYDTVLHEVKTIIGVGDDGRYVVTRWPKTTSVRAPSHDDLMSVDLNRVPSAQEQKKASLRWLATQPEELQRILKFISNSWVSNETPPAAREDEAMQKLAQVIATGTFKG